MAGELLGAVAALLGIAALVGFVVLRRRHLTLVHFGGALPFRCRARVELGEAPGLRRGDRRRWRRGIWVHDVLLLEHGWLTPRLIPHAVESTDTLERSPDGLQLVGLRLYLDDGAVLRLTAHVRDRTALVGPFLLAELNASPNNRLMRGNR